MAANLIYYLILLFFTFQDEILSYLVFTHPLRSTHRDTIIMLGTVLFEPHSEIRFFILQTCLAQLDQSINSSDYIDVICLLLNYCCIRILLNNVHSNKFLGSSVCLILVTSVLTAQSLKYKYRVSYVGRVIVFTLHRLQMLFLWLLPSYIS